MRQLLTCLLFTASSLSIAPSLRAQSVPPLQQRVSPLPQANLTPGQIELITLESKFSDDVGKRGGKAFASWFADDGVELSNGQPPLQGLAAIVAGANWDPKDYQLSWYAEGAQMGAAGDTGFTWGHFDSTFKDAKGNPATRSGRYVTFWKKVNGAWKVALDAGADDAPTAVAAH
jgi:ketosteroid isomerase-like protein